MNNIFTLFLFFLFSFSSYSQRNDSSSIRQAVKLPSKVVKRDSLNQAGKDTIIYTGKDSAIYTITLNVNEPNTDLLYIPQFGFTKNNSTIKFLSYTDEIKILDKDTTKLLRILKVDNPAILMPAEAVVELPDLNAFPRNEREEVVRDANKFEALLREELNKNFANGYIRLGDQNKFTIITPFKKVNTPSSQTLNAQVSVRVTYFFKEDQLTKYKANYVARENKSHDKAWRAPGEVASNAAQQFFADLIKQINK